MRLSSCRSTRRQTSAHQFSTQEWRHAKERYMSTNTITKDEKATPKPSDALHFFIYDVLYVAVLGAILYDLLKGPEGDLRRWSIEWSLAVTYVVDCLYTRARLRSFEEKNLKGEDFLNT